MGVTLDANGKPKAIVKARGKDADPLLKRRAKSDADARAAELATVLHAEALEMRLDGWSYRDIAAKFGVSPGEVFKWVETELVEYREKTMLDTKLVFEMDMGRLDRLLRYSMERAAQGDMIAVNAAIRVLERRAKMLGLDAPAKSEWLGALTPITPESAAKMSETEIADRVRILMEKVISVSPKLALNAKAKE